MSRILIVDDEAVISTHLEVKLRAMGYEVVGRACSGESSIRMAESLEPDLVIMDIVMQGAMDGIDAASRIRARRDVPVIFLTAYSSDAFIDRAKRIGPIAYITKPFNEREIRAAIEIALHRTIDRSWPGEPAGPVRLDRRYQALDLENHRLQQQLARVREARDRVRQLVERLEPFITGLEGGLWDCEFEPDGRLADQLYLSPGLRRISGYSRQELPDSLRAWNELIHHEDLEQIERLLAEHLSRHSDRPFGFDYRLRDREGRQHWLYCCSRLRFDPAGRPRRWTGVDLEITERKLREERVSHALREKETMLLEAHHRVKNNLQILSSLLDMAAGRHTGRGVREACRDARAKILTISLIHSQLYQSRQMNGIDLGKYFEELVEYLSSVYTTRSGNVVMWVEVEEVVVVPVGRAIPCALAINELVTNSLKHAFPGDRPGRVEVRVRSTGEGGRVRIEVRDNGRGLPEGFDSMQSGTMGLGLAISLVREQLGGTIEFLMEHGTAVLVEFDKNQEG